MHLSLWANCSDAESRRGGEARGATLEVLTPLVCTDLLPLLVNHISVVLDIVFSLSIFSHWLLTLAPDTGS
jgi:hypothetical protein